MSGVGVDLDRLAEYAAGLLDTHDATEVERLIAERPDWAQALAALRMAQPRVRTALAGLDEVPVPDDVVLRLDAALADAARPAPANVIDLASRRRRRWTRVGTVAAAAAAVAAAGVGGVAVFSNGGAQEKQTSTSGAAPAARGPDQLGGGAVDSPQRATPALVVLASGNDYTETSVTGVGVNRQPVRPEAQTTPGTDRAVPGELTRLTAPAARDACLSAITARYGGTPTLLDYAHYRSEPALVVVLNQGRSRIVVVGPRCGLPGAGSDSVAAVAG